VLRVEGGLLRRASRPWPPGSPWLRKKNPSGHWLVYCQPSPRRWCDGETFLGVALIAAGATLSAAGQSTTVQPTLTPQDSGTTNGLIAVSPVNPEVVWASGRAGTFVVTTDGGRTWKAGMVPGAEALQFRDVEGVSAKVAYLQSIGTDPTDFRIYKTVDGGATWTMQFQNQDPARSTIASPSGHRSAASRTATP